jgi:hypothetical protein
MKKLSGRESAISRQKSPPEKKFYRTRRWSSVRTRVDSMEGIMYDFKNYLKLLVPRETRYCVWIREHEGENAPLI